MAGKVNLYKKNIWPQWTTKFLLTLQKNGNVGTACVAAGISRQTPYLLRESDPKFQEAWDAAKADAVDTVEDAVWARARDGIVRLKFDGKGNPIKDPRTGKWYEERQYSDSLALAILSAYKDEYRRDKGVAVNFVIQASEQIAERLDLPLEQVVEGAYKVLNEGK